jgi:hypothetical protein
VLSRFKFSYIVDIKLNSGQLFSLPTSALEHFKAGWNTSFNAELKGLHDGVIYISGNGLVTWTFDWNTGKTTFFYVKNVVFELFPFYIGIKEKCHVYSFAEQVELYRLVYNSIRSIDNFREKKSRLWIQCCTWKGVSVWHSHLIISPRERFERMSNTSFDAELNGLQNGIYFFWQSISDLDIWSKYWKKQDF